MTVHGESPSQATLDADAASIAAQVAALSTHPNVAASNTANPSPAEIAAMLNQVTSPAP